MKSPPSVSPKTKGKLVKGPPTKQKKQVTPSSETDRKSDSDFQPNSCASSDRDGRPPKKAKNTPGQSTGEKNRGGDGIGKRPDLVWCRSSSELDENGKKQEPVIYINEELFCLYETIIIC